MAEERHIDCCYDVHTTGRGRNITAHAFFRTPAHVDDVREIIGEYMVNGFGPGRVGLVGLAVQGLAVPVLLAYFRGELEYDGPRKLILNTLDIDQQGILPAIIDGETVKEEPRFEMVQWRWFCTGTKILADGRVEVTYELQSW